MKQSTLTTSLPTNNIKQHQHLNLDHLWPSVGRQTSRSDQAKLQLSAQGGGSPTTCHHEDSNLGKDGCCVCICRQELVSPGALLTLESQRRYHVHRRSSTDLLRDANGRRIVHGMSLFPPARELPTSYQETRPLRRDFQKYNPELQRRSLERRKEKQEDFDTFVNKLKDYSKSDKHSMLYPDFCRDVTMLMFDETVWQVWEDELAKKRAEGVTAELERRRAADAEAQARKEELRQSIK